MVGCKGIRVLGCYGVRVLGYSGVRARARARASAMGLLHALVRDILAWWEALINSFNAMSKRCRESVLSS